MKLKSLIGNFGTENMFKADDKIDGNVILDKKSAPTLFADPCTFCMDADYVRSGSRKLMGDALLSYRRRRWPGSVYEGHLGGTNPSVEREITWTEPAVKGDTSKKPESLPAVAVPLLFVSQGDVIMHGSHRNRLKVSVVRGWRRP